MQIYKMAEDNFLQFLFIDEKWNYCNAENVQTKGHGY